MVKRLIARSKAAPPPEAAPPLPSKSIDEWYAEVEREHPDWDVFTISQKAFRLATEQEQMQPPPPGPEADAPPSGPVGHPRGRPTRLIRGLVALLAFVVIGALGWAWFASLRPNEAGSPTPAGVAEPAEPAETSSLAAVRFADDAPRQVVVGEQVALPLVVTGGDGQPLSGQALLVVVSPLVAGTAELSRDGTQVLFTAGATPGDVTIIARAADNAKIATEPLRLTISSAATLSLRLEPPAPDTLRPNEPFPMRFLLTNSGQTSASGVRLAVKTPNGLTLDEERTFALTNQSCAPTAEGVECQINDLTDGIQGSITFFYKPAAAGPIGFDPTHYRLSYAGSDASIINSTSDTVWAAEVPAPQPATVAVVAGPAELPADGKTQATVTVTVLDQWGAPYTSSVRLSLAPRRPGAEAAATPTPVAPIRCWTTNDEVLVRERIATHHDDLSPRIGEALPNDAQLMAYAYWPSADRLFVEVQEASPRRGWVTVKVLEVTRIECDGDKTKLPVLPSPVNPEGVAEPAGPQEVTEGQKAFTYTAGSVPGAVELVAQLVDEDGTPIGEAGRGEVTLLEMGWLGEVSDAYAEPDDAANLTGARVMIQGLPIGTPLELYPEQADTPGARQAAVRVWLPAGALSEATVTTLDQPVRVGATPDAELNNQPDAGLRLGNETLNTTVMLLGAEVNGYQLARFVIWVPGNNVYLDR